VELESVFHVYLIVVGTITGLLKKTYIQSLAALPGIARINGMG
jgi:hypothetical protein